VGWAVRVRHAVFTNSKATRRTKIVPTLLFLPQAEGLKILLLSVRKLIQTVLFIFKMKQWHEPLTQTITALDT